MLQTRTFSFYHSAPGESSDDSGSPERDEPENGVNSDTNAATPATAASLLPKKPKRSRYVTYNPEIAKMVHRMHQNGIMHYQINHYLGKNSSFAGDVLRSTCPLTGRSLKQMPAAFNFIWKGKTSRPSRRGKTRSNKTKDDAELEIDRRILQFFLDNPNLGFHEGIRRIRDDRLVEIPEDYNLQNMRRRVAKWKSKEAAQLTTLPVCGYNELVAELKALVAPPWGLDHDPPSRTILCFQFDYRPRVPVVDRMIRLCPSPYSEHILEPTLMVGEVELSRDAVLTVLRKAVIEEVHDVQMLMAYLGAMERKAVVEEEREEGADEPASGSHSADEMDEEEAAETPVAAPRAPPCSRIPAPSQRRGVLLKKNDKTFVYIPPLPNAIPALPRLIPQTLRLPATRHLVALPYNAAAQSK